MHAETDEGRQHHRPPGKQVPRSVRGVVEFLCECFGVLSEFRGKVIQNQRAVLWSLKVKANLQLLQEEMQRFDERPIALQVRFQDLWMIGTTFRALAKVLAVRSHGAQGITLREVRGHGRDGIA